MVPPLPALAPTLREGLTLLHTRALALDDTRELAEAEFRDWQADLLQRVPIQKETRVRTRPRTSRSRTALELVKEAKRQKTEELDAKGRRPTYVEDPLGNKEYMYEILLYCVQHRYQKIKHRGKEIYQ